MGPPHLFCMPNAGMIDCTTRNGDKCDVLIGVNRKQIYRLLWCQGPLRICFNFKTNFVIFATWPPAASSHCVWIVRDLFSKSTDDMHILLTRDDLFLSLRSRIEQSDICLEKIRYVFCEIPWKRRNAAHMFPYRLASSRVGPRRTSERANARMTIQDLVYLL